MGRSAKCALAVHCCILEFQNYLRQKRIPANLKNRDDFMCTMLGYFNLFIHKYNQLGRSCEKEAHNSDGCPDLFKRLREASDDNTPFQFHVNRIHMKKFSKIRHGNDKTLVKTIPRRSPDRQKECKDLRDKKDKIYTPALEEERKNLPKDHKDLKIELKSPQYYVYSVEVEKPEEHPLMTYNLGATDGENKQPVTQVNIGVPLSSLDKLGVAGSNAIEDSILIHLLKKKNFNTIITEFLRKYVTGDETSDLKTLSQAKRMALSTAKGWILAVLHTFISDAGKREDEWKDEQEDGSLQASPLKTAALKKALENFKATFVKPGIEPFEVKQPTFEGR